MNVSEGPTKTSQFRCASAPISRLREVQVQPSAQITTANCNSNNIPALHYKEHSPNNYNHHQQGNQQPLHVVTHHRSQRPPLCRSETDCSAEFETVSNRESFHSSETIPRRGGMGRESRSLINLAESLKEEAQEADSNVEEQQMDNSSTTQMSIVAKSGNTENNSFGVVGEAVTTTTGSGKNRSNNQINCYSNNRLQPVNLLAKAQQHYHTNSGPGKTIRGSKEKIVYLRERKALKTIGIVVLGFIICWMPFFVVYLLEVFLNNVSATYSFKLLNEFFLWLGYSNSVLNPIIYTMYNGDFRRCFRDLLGLGCVQQHRRTMSVKKLHQQSTLF